MEEILIDGLCYTLDAENLTAELIGSNDITSNKRKIKIPAQVQYEQKTYKVTSIGHSAFSHYSSLISITIPDSVNKIKSGALCGVPSLKSIIVDPGNPTYDSRDNCQAIIETASNKLIAGCQKTIIPDSVTSIGPSAFLGCKSLTSITIPDSVTEIGDSAFEDCYSLTSITIPNSVTEIGHSAFANCKSLLSITIPNGIKHINADTFFDCYSLTSITIPDSVTEIGDWAFFSCNSLTSITLPEGLTYIGWHAFLGNDALTAIDYHGTKEQWQQIKKHDEWNDSPNIQVVRCRDGVLRL